MGHVTASYWSHPPPATAQAGYVPHSAAAAAAATTSTATHFPTLFTSRSQTLLLLLLLLPLLEAGLLLPMLLLPAGARQWPNLFLNSGTLQCENWHNDDYD